MSAGAPAAIDEPLPTGRPGASADSAFTHVRTRLGALIHAFALEAWRREIVGSYDALIHGSLDHPLGTRPLRGSRLSEDGTPVQFATTLGAGASCLRLVGDVGPLEASGAERMRRARAAMDDVAGLLGIRPELEGLRPLLGLVAPSTDRALLADPAGAFWIGAAFSPAGPPRMRLYVNGAWGTEPQRRERMHAFAAHFGQRAAWSAMAAGLPAELSFLGMCVTLANGRRPRGAFYFRAFGLKVEDYATVAARLAGSRSAEAIRRFAAALLGDDIRYPTTSAILSVGFGDRGQMGVELEFCCHCLFRNEDEAEGRLLRLFSAMDVDAAPYRTLRDGMRGLAPHRGPVRSHAFVGVDTKAAEPALTVYMKPDLAAP